MRANYEMLTALIGGDARTSSKKKASVAVAPKKAAAVGRPRRNPKRVSLSDFLQKFKRDQIKRVARVAGVVRLSGTVYEHVRGWIGEIVERFIKDAVIYTEYLRHKIITSDDMLNAWQRNFGRMYGAAEADDERCRLFKKQRGAPRARPGVRAVQEVKHYQAQADCVHFPRAAFVALVRAVANKYGTDIKLSKDAVTLAQVCVEGLVVHLLAMAQLAALHDGQRMTVQPKDLILVHAFLGHSMAHCPASTMPTL